MNLFGVMDISGSALEAERMRAEVVAANMANANTTRTENGKPYQRQHVVFQSSRRRSAAGLCQHVAVLRRRARSVSGGGGGVSVWLPSSAIRQLRLQRYDPGHPDANAKGFVTYPNINPLTEMVDLMGAQRAYGMNVSAVTAAKSMITSTLDLLK